MRDDEKCQWPGCEYDADPGGIAHSVGRAPNARAVEFCRRHESEWSEMVAAGKVDELHAKFDKGA